MNKCETFRLNCDSRGGGQHSRYCALQSHLENISTERIEIILATRFIALSTHVSKIFHHYFNSYLISFADYRVAVMVPRVGIHVQLLDECSNRSSSLHHAMDQSQTRAVQPTNTEASCIANRVCLSLWSDSCKLDNLERNPTVWVRNLPRLFLYAKGAQQSLRTSFLAVLCSSIFSPATHILPVVLR